MNVQSMLLAIIQPEDKEAAVQALIEAGLRVTVISTMGGFLLAGSVTLLIGLEHEQESLAIDLLTTKCRKRTSFVNAAPYAAEVHSLGPLAMVEVQISGATILVLPVVRFMHVDSEVSLSEQIEGRKDTMKLVIAIVPEERSNAILDTLREAEYRVTLISTTGGFWRKGNATLLIGVESEKVDDVLEHIQVVCSPTASKDHLEKAWATIFVMDVAQYKQV
jgi:uncharacterized protein YaaQ